MAPPSSRTSTTSACTASIPAPSRCRSHRTSTASVHRYADGRITPDGSLWIGVRERHAESDRSKDVVNELVAIPTDGSSEPRVIAGGRDFYSSPRISSDGRRLCFLAWNLPWMPWDGCELFVADLAADGAPERRRRTSPAQTASSRSGSRSGARPATSSSRAIAAAGGTSSGYVTASAASCIRPKPSSATRRGRSARDRSPSSATGASCARTTATGSRTSASSTPTGGARAARAGTRLAPGIAVRLRRGLARRPDRRIRRRSPVGSSVSTSRAAGTEVLRTSVELSRWIPRTSRRPGPIEFPTEGGLTAHAFVYPPTNPDFEAPDGELPPLIVVSHGGPTGNATADLQPRDAVLDEPRLRSRRRQLRRLDRVRPRLSRAPER